MYRTLESVGNKASLHILSFQKLESTNISLREAQSESGRSLSGPVYRFDVFDDSNATRLPPSAVDEEDFTVDLIYTLLIGTSDFLLAMARRGDGSQARSRWEPLNF